MEAASSVDQQESINLVDPTGRKGADGAACEVSTLTSQKLHALLRTNEILAMQLGEARYKLVHTEDALCRAATYVSFETKFAIMCMNLLPGFIRRTIRRIVAFGYAVRGG